MIKGKKNFSCECDKCKLACDFRPGWFLPNQIHNLLHYFKVQTTRELLGKNKLAIDWWVGDESDVLILAPNIVGNNNIQYPNNPKGKCVFFENGRCNIYKTRPFECASLAHEKPGVNKKRHKEVASEWKKDHQLDKFEDEISTDTYSLFDSIGMLMGTPFDF